MPLFKSTSYFAFLPSFVSFDSSVTSPSPSSSSMTISSSITMSCPKIEFRIRAMAYAATMYAEITNVRMSKVNKTVAGVSSAVLPSTRSASASKKGAKWFPSFCN